MMTVEQLIKERQYDYDNGCSTETPHDLIGYFIRDLKSLTPTEERLKTIEEVISYIGKNEGREESEDFYREHFGLPKIYD